MSAVSTLTAPTGDTQGGLLQFVERPICTLNNIYIYRQERVQRGAGGGLGRAGARDREGGQRRGHEARPQCGKDQVSGFPNDCILLVLAYIWSACSRGRNKTAARRTLSSGPAIQSSLKPSTGQTQYPPHLTYFIFYRTVNSKAGGHSFLDKFQGEITDRIVIIAKDYLNKYLYLNVFFVMEIY